MQTSGKKPGRTAASAWQSWLLALAVIALIVLLMLPRWISLGRSAPEPQELLQPLEPLVIKISPDLRTSDVVPAEPGSLSGCNLLLVTIDTTRADRIGCYGNTNIDTPTLDGLAADGVLFSQAMAPAPTTLPSHGAMLTGLYPLNHGARANGLFLLEDETITLAEVLRDRGYSTAAFISAWVLAARFGIDSGFDDFDDDLPRLLDREEPEGPGAQQREVSRNADQTNERAFPWLRAHAEAPFFLWVHYYDPHRPYAPPSPYLEEYEHPYEGEIAYTDYEVGRLLSLLAELGHVDDTLVVIAGDHGEGMGQHNEWTHSFLLYESTQHVPFIMRCGQRLSGGVNVDRPVSLVDLTPTVLSLLGVEAPPGLDGVDLTQPADATRPLYAETCALEAGFAPLRAVRKGSMKYVYGPIPELFDLSKDPLEETNLIQTESATADELAKTVSGFYGDEIDRDPQPTVAPSPEEREKLIAMGYLDGGDSGSSAEDLPDPKVMMDVLRQVNETVGRPPEERIEVLESIAREHPEFPLACYQLGKAYKESGDLDRAAETLEKGVGLHPRNPPILLLLGSVERQQGDAANAIETYRRVLDISPDHVEALSALGALHAGQKEFDLAAEYLTKAFQAAPHHELLRKQMVAVLQPLGRLDQAVELLDAAVRHDPDLDTARDHLFGILRREERYAEAADMLRVAIRARPRKLDLVNDLAALLAACRDANVRDPAQAVRLAGLACEQEPENPRYLFTLASAYSANGQIDMAVAVATRAIQIARSQGQTRLAETIRNWLGSLRAANPETETSPRP